MTVQEKCKSIHDALVTLSIGPKKVKHYFHERMQAPYVIWAEDGPDDYFNADNRRGEWTVHGTIDFFTKKEFDPVFDEIQELLNRVFGSRWRWNSTQYEDGTGLIHHEWDFVL